MANITQTDNVTPEEQTKYVTDPELLKQLNSVGTPQSSTAGYVTDPELLNQLNAPAQTQIPMELQGKAEAPGDTSTADFLANIAKPVAAAVGSEFDPNAPHPFISSAAKGAMSIKSMFNDEYLSNMIPLMEKAKKDYGKDFEKAPPEKQQQLLGDQAALISALNKREQYRQDVEAVTKKYGTDEFSKKADALYATPEFQNASTLKQIQLYGNEVISNPQYIPAHIATVSLESLPSTIRALLAATFARFMGLGPSGSATAAGAESTSMEYASGYIDARQQGLSHDEAHKQAGSKAVMVGLMDALSFASAGKALDKIMDQVDKGVVKRVVSTAKETAKELNKQGFYGLSGEVLGSVASGQKVDPRAALDEYFGELATGPLEALTTYQGKLAEEKAAGAPPAPPEPPPGANVPPPGPGTPPPTTGAIIDTSEFDAEDIPGAIPTVPPAPPTVPPPPPEAQATKTVTDKVQDMIGKELKQATQDEKGQQILDDLDAKGVAPQSVAEQFWNDTFFKLPAQTQQYFKNYLKKITGMEPGSVLAVDGEGNEIIAKDWVDLGKYNAVDLGDRVDYLEGTDRGYVALLDEANRRFENAQVPSPEPATIPEKAEKAKPEAKKPVYLEKEKDELVKALINSIDSDMGRLLNMKWNDGEIRKDSDLDQFRRVARESLARQEERKKRLEEQGQGNKPIEDKAVEAEALALADELEKYQPGFAAGFRSSIAKGVIQKSEDLDFYRRRTAEYKAQAEGTAAPVKEKQNMETTFYEPNSIEWKNRQKALKTASPELKDMYDKVNTTLQDITDHINQNGWSISNVNQGKAPKNLVDLGSLIPNLQSDINQALIKSERIVRNRLQLKPVNPKDEANLKLRMAALNKVLQAAKDGIAGNDITDQIEAAKLENVQKEINQARQEEQRAKAAPKEAEPKIEQAIPMARKGTYEYAARLLDSSLKNNEITRDDYNNIGWFLRQTSTPIKDTIKKINDAIERNRKPEVKEPAKLAQKEAEPKPELAPKEFSKDIQARLDRILRLATLAEKKVMDKPLTMDDVVNAYNRVEDSKKEENLANTEKNMARQAEDKLLIKIDKEYVNQFQTVPPKKQGLIAAIKNGSLDISKQEWAKDAYDIFKIKEKDIKTTKKPEGASDAVAEQLKKFNAGNYRMPEKVRGTKDESLQMSGTPSAKYAEEENKRNFKVYEEAAKLFLEGHLDAKPEKTLETEGFKDNSIQPQPIEKKSADKAIANAEEQNKVISEIIDKKDVRYYLGGILIDRENDRMVTCDGHRATILKKPDYSSVPNPPEKTTGDLILKDDGTWIDGKYPAIDRIIPESHADNKITVNAKDIADYARGIEKANKFIKSDEVFSLFLQNPDAFGTFNAKFIRQMGDLFRRFGYKDIILSLDEGKKLFATSPDGKLSHIVMGIRSKNEIFKTFSKIFRVEKAKGARGDGQTIESIKDRIVRDFGRSVKKLFDDGIIVVVNTVGELNPKYQNELDAQDKAFFDKETGVAYIIADRVSAGDVRAVVLHEVGEHYGLRGMLGEKVYNEQLNNLKKQKNTDITVAKAWEYVTKNYANLLETDEKQFLREVMARIGENAPNHNLWKRFVTAIKTFLVKKGIIKNLTGTELQDLVMRSLHTVTKGRRVLSSGTGLESARGPTDPDAKRELDDEFRANDVPDAPFNNQKDIADKLTENIKEAKTVIKDISAAPKQSGIKMISGVDKALTTFRVKNVFFGAGIEETEAKKYAGKLIDGMGKAVATVSLTNAIHAGHIAANVMELGKLTFNQATQMFQAVRSQFAMSNIFKLEKKLFKKLGKQTATNLINTFFEAKRARSIQNEYLNREAELERAIDAGEDPEVAQRNYDAIVKAYKKIPEYFQRRNANGDLMFTDVIENGEIVDQLPILNDDVIDDYIRKDQDFPELKEMMNNWTAINHNMLDNMVFAGIISAKRGASLKAIKDYVPWFRVQDGAEELHAPSTFVAGLTNISKERVFRKGAVSERIDNMIDNMVYNVMMMTRNSIRNYSALQIAKAYATRKPNGKLQVFPKEGVMPDGAVRTNILVNGRRIIIEIKDPNHAAALMGLENLELPILDTLSSFSQGLRRGVTTNPFFQWWQVWKDAPTAAAVTGLKSPLKVWGKILGSFFMALNPNDPIVQTLKSYGIGGFQSSGRTAEKEVGLTRGKALMNIGPWILDILDHIGDASDYAQRRIIYQETIKQGGTEMEALFRANAVIDFLRHGNSKAALALVRTVTFMNAYIQQIDVLATSMAGGGFKGMDRKKARERFRRTTYTLIATGLVYCMMKGGDDDYEKLDDQTKMRNFIIGDYKIPINTSYGFMFKALPEMIYNYIIKHGTSNAIDETRLRKALARAALDSLLGPNPIATGLKAPVEIILNHDFFTGGTVTPRGMENLDVYMQYTSSTSNLAKLFSHLTLGALSPIEADHLMRGLFGTVGSTAGWLSDMFTSDKPDRVWARNPIIGQVFLPPEPRGREDLFYELKQRSDEAYNTWETMNKRYHKAEAKEYFEENKSLIRTHDYITNAEAGLKEINAEIRRLSDDRRLTPAEKRKRITYFQQKKNNILESVNRERLRAEK